MGRPYARQGENEGGQQPERLVNRLAYRRRRLPDQKIIKLDDRN
jgi:hypothetical protein